MILIKQSNIYPNLSAAPLYPVPLSTNISNEQQLRLNKVNEIKDYFLAEIRERELLPKILVNI